jgi:hypothetical protein
MYRIPAVYCGGVSEYIQTLWLIILTYNHEATFYSHVSYYNQLSEFFYFEMSLEKLTYKPVHKATTYFAIENFFPFKIAYVI